MKYRFNIILFEINANESKFKAYIDDTVIERADLKKLLMHVHATHNKECFDIVNELKMNIHAIDKEQHHIIGTIKSMPTMHGLLGIISQECMNYIAIGYI